MPRVRIPALTRGLTALNSGSLPPQTPMGVGRLAASSGRPPSPGLGASTVGGGASILSGRGGGAGVGASARAQGGCKRSASLSPRSSQGNEGMAGPARKDVWSGQGGGYLSGQSRLSGTFGGSNASLRQGVVHDGGIGLTRPGGGGGALKATRGGEDEEEFVSFLSTFEKDIKELSHRHAPPRSPYI